MNIKNQIEPMQSELTVSQRLAICFTAGVLGSLAVLLFSHVLSWFGLGVKGPIHFPVPLKAPGMYRPLFRVAAVGCISI
jgi:hypothetical protein